jgi:hypothetical protein
MPLYFFNAVRGNEEFVDSIGQEVDEDTAWDLAHEGARALMRSHLTNPVDWPLTTLEVTTSAGDVVLELPFLEACK